MPARDDTRRAALAASFCAVLGIAAQVAGKAARDAIFLDNFSVTRLPALLVSASVLSVVAALGMARAMARRSPGRLVPLVNLISAVLLMVEWFALERVPRPAAIAVYLHQSVFGAILVSGFWSLVAESFDPRTARKVMGTIGAGATLGGVLGAVVAERAAAIVGTHFILPVLAGLQLIAAWRLWALARMAHAPRPSDQTPLAVGEAVRSIFRVALLRHLALLVVIGTISAALLDYVFKARAADSFRGVNLLRFFAAYYGAVGVATAANQWTVGRVSLESWGIARTLGTLPAAVVGFSTAAVAFPGLATVVAARSAENVLRNSLFRQAYEVLFTPLPPRERRSTKTVVDVAAERVGDALGGALVAIGLYAGASAPPLLLGGAVIVSGVGLWVAKRVQKSYVEALERSLVARAIELDLDEVQDKTSRALLMTMHRTGTLGPSLVGLSGDVGVAERALPPETERSSAVRPLDPLLSRAADMRSGDAARVKAALDGPPLPPLLVGLAIPLLAWDEVARTATQVLIRVAPRAVGQLVDSLVDPDEEFAVRRRLPRVIGTARGLRASQGLLAGLQDARFEVRYRCARALARLHFKEPSLPVDRSLVFAAVARELAVDEHTWKDLSVLDADERDVDASGGVPALVDDLLRDRANRGLEQVFTLLTLVLPPEPIRIAFRALHTDDRNLRGTALEYLEQVVPGEIREKLWPHIEADAGRRGAARPREQVTADLMASQAAIHLSLQRR